MKLSAFWDVALALFWFGTGFLYLSESTSRRLISTWRQIIFITGISLGAVITVGPVAHAAIHTFWIHMIQHIGLMMLISPMLVLGAPIAVAQNSKQPRLRSLTQATLSGRSAKLLFNPTFGFLLFLTVLVSTHFSPLADAGMRNPNVHCLELILFIVGGFIYYYPVMEGNPTPVHVPYSTRVLSLFAMMLPETMVGFFLYSGNRLLHALPDGMNMSTGVNDQHTGGAIMWAMGMLIDTIWIVLAARDWFESEKRLAEAEDE